MRDEGLHQPAKGGRLTRPVAIGTAGWTIPSALADAFPGEGGHFERYARRLTVTEINSSFHRPHRPGTYQRWAAAVPDGFRFSVKLPKTISHEGRMVGTDDLLDQFLEEIVGLGEKLAVLLLQLPPSFAFDRAVADGFFADLRRRTDVAVACEPRHPSWFEAEAESCLAAHRVARVAADPVLAPGGEAPGGWPGLRYYRLHGAPRIYYSAYEGEFLTRLADRLRAGDESADRWCIFDNTASGAATGDALALQAAFGS